jgi:ubiquinone/menaquinone biosynthesis C-methylase UbiE
VGTGANYVSLSEALPNQMGRFNLHGIGPTLEPLSTARKTTQEKGIELRAVCGDPLNLPYRNDFFHLVIRVGGVRTLSDIARAMKEMLRVTMPEGHVLIIDEGISPRLRGSDRGRRILEQRPSAGVGPPIQYIPERTREVEISYIVDDAFYQLSFRK